MIDAATLLPWSEPKEVPTRAGKKLVREALDERITTVSVSPPIETGSNDTQTESPRFVLHGGAKCQPRFNVWCVAGFLVMEQEQWSVISAWSAYQVSSHGNVRRDGRQIAIFKVRGYLSFNVSDGKKRKSLRVHRQVAEAFIPNPHSHPLVRHLDGVRENCHEANLAWGTSTDNEADKKGHGRSLIGERHHQHKLTWDNVRAIRASQLSDHKLASMFSVTVENIRHILTGRTWRE